MGALCRLLLSDQLQHIQQYVPRIVQVRCCHATGCVELQGNPSVLKQQGVLGLSSSCTSTMRHICFVVIDISTCHTRAAAGWCNANAVQVFGEVAVQLAAPTQAKVAVAQTLMSLQAKYPEQMSSLLSQLPQEKQAALQQMATAG